MIESAFEEVSPPAAGPFDLVFAATAWHWLNPAIRFRRAWELLKPGGHLAFWGATHVFPPGGDPFFAEVQEVYEAIGAGLPEGMGYPRPGDLPDQRAEIERSGLFDDVVVRHFDWEVEYDADSYLRLLDTFSGHIAMRPADDVAHRCYSASVGDPDPIGIRELRQNASRYVDMAESGKRVPVTKRGKLVAYLVPAEEPRSVYQQMVAAGQVRLATGDLRDLLPPPAREPGERPLSEVLQEIRDEERY